MGRKDDIDFLEAFGKDTPRVTECICSVMRKHRGLSDASDARYYEAVHQELAPLARELERELIAAKAAQADLWNQLKEARAARPSPPREKHP